MSSTAPRADRGLRTIAVLEGLKGLGAAALGLAIVGMRHRDFEAVARALVTRSEADPTGRWAGWVIKAGADLNHAGVGFIAGLALAYAAMRLVECYGLWRERRWAAWFGVLSGGIYIPFELADMLRGLSLFNVGALILNVLIVAYLAYRLRHPQPAQTT